MTSTRFVLIPTYNEAGNLPQLISRINDLPYDLNILIIDDNSPDGTGMIAEDLKCQFPQVSVIHHKKKEGVGKAYLLGFNEAFERGADVVLMMDADLSHDPQFIGKLLEKIEQEGFDVVIGSRHVPGAKLYYPWYRKLLSASAIRFSRILMRLPVRDCTSGFRCFNRDCLSILLNKKSFSEGYVFMVEILYVLRRHGKKFTEVPIVFIDREWGESKMSVFQEIFQGVFSLLKLRWVSLFHE